MKFWTKYWKKCLEGENFGVFTQLSCGKSWFHCHFNGKEGFMHITGKLRLWGYQNCPYLSILSKKCGHSSEFNRIGHQLEIVIEGKHWKWPKSLTPYKYMTFCTWYFLKGQNLNVP